MVVVAGIKRTVVVVLAWEPTTTNKTHFLLLLFVSQGLLEHVVVDTTSEENDG